MQITIDSANVKIENGKVIIDVEPNQIGWLDTTSIAKYSVILSDLKPKDEFKIGDEVFIVLEQTENGTRVIAK